MVNTPNESTHISRQDTPIESQTVGRDFDLSTLAVADRNRYDSLMADTTQLRGGGYEGKTFREIIDTEKPLTPEKLQNIMSIVEVSNPALWSQVFEANYNNADKEIAKAQEKSWSTEMRKKYRAWKMEKTQGIDTKVITEEQRLAENNTKAINKAQQADEAGAKAINTAQQADEAGAKAITEEQRLAENNAKKAEETADAARKFKESQEAVDGAMKLLDSSLQAEINQQVKDQTDAVIKTLESDPQSTDNRIVRKVDGTVNREATKTRIQAQILVNNQDRYSSSITDVSRREEFGNYIKTLENSGIQREIRGAENITKSISVDPALPREVQKRHEETARTVLKDATDISGRRYPNGNYVIDYRGKTGQAERLILDGVGNVTHTRKGLEISSNSLRHKLDTSESDKIKRSNQELDKIRMRELSGGYSILSDIEKSNQKVNSDTLQVEPIIPGIQNPTKEITALAKLSFPRDKKEGEDIIAKLRETDRGNRTLIDGYPTKGAIKDLDTAEKKLSIFIQDYEATMNKYQEVPNANKKFSDEMDRFSETAKYNLNFLTKIGYDSLGQDELDRIIKSLNSPSNPRRSEVGEIDLSDKLDTPKTQALTLAIANLVRSGRQSSAPTSPEQTKQEQSQKTWDNVDKTDHIIAAHQTQSFGFRDALLSVKRNMTQEGGSLKTRGQLDKTLFGIDQAPEVNKSALNTISDNPTLA